MRNKEDQEVIVDMALVIAILIIVVIWALP